MSTTTFSSSRCRGTTKRGTQCRIDWDLNENQLCKYHEFQALALDGTLDPASTPEKPSTLAVPTPSAEAGGPLVTPRTTASTASTRGASPSTTPVWTAQYIASTRTIVLRMYSEWSWQCHHEPIVLKVSRWGSIGCTAISCVVGLAREVPILGGLLEHTEAAMTARVQASVDLQTTLKIMGAEDGRVFESDCSALPVQTLLQSLLQLKHPTVNQEFVIYLSKLVPVEIDNCPVFWVSEDERKTLGTETLTRQPKLANASVHLLFERVSGRFFDDSVGAMIHWELRKGDPQSEPIASGIACANERVPVRSVRRAELGHCILTVEVKKTRWLVGDLVASGSKKLVGIPLSSDDRDDETDADDPELEPLHVGWGRVVHFRILATTSVV